MIDVWTVDFETWPIGPRPEHYPPMPTSVSIRNPNGVTVFLNWGHPGAEHADQEWKHATHLLNRAWASDLPIVFHNAKFDIDVAMEWFKLPMLPWERIHDTMIQAFLVDPYARQIGLKQLAVDYLGMPKDERDAVDEWVVANKDRVPLFEFIKNSKGEPFGKPTKRNAGAWIGFAPAELVGPYAVGDTERTWRLFQTFAPMIRDSGMWDAYDIERQVLPIFMENERVGLRVDVERLSTDVEMYHKVFEYVEEWLRWRLNSQGLNLDADQDVADALERTGIVTEFESTKTGKRSVSKNNLHPDQFSDPQVASALGYRNRLKTCLKMFMEPWLAQATHRQGWISTNWNQVASPDGGTRTGRPSTRDPNFLNLSKNFEGRGDGYEHPDFLSLPPLPLVRRYILADEGCVVVKRDFSGQELRIFGHYENGDLQRQYQENPALDVHHYVGSEISNMTGDSIWTEDDGRTRTKAMNFQGIYGGGVPALQKALRVSYQEAKAFKAFHNQALPGRQVLANTLTTIVRSGYAVRTWGGRLYTRPPFFKRDNGEMSDADYRLINYLVQGSAADITKWTMVQLHNHPDYNARFMLQVYDELNESVPFEDAARQMRVMEEVMGSVPLKVKMLSDGEVGLNWGEMKKIKGDVSLEQCLAELGVA